MDRRASGKKILTKIKNDDLVKERHNQIFQAASGLIQNKGYHGTTLRDISRETSIGLGNLYDYISTKEDILYLVHEKAMETIIDALNERKSDITDPVERLKEKIGAELETMDKYQDLILSLYQETHALSKPSLRSMLRREEEHMNDFKEVLEEGMQLRIFKQCDSTMLANIIKMMIDCWVLRRWALRNKISLKTMKEGIIEVILSGIINNERA